jgi:hypothetical protein
MSHVSGRDAPPGRAPAVPTLRRSSQTRTLFRPRHRPALLREDNGDAAQASAAQACLQELGARDVIERSLTTAAHAASGIPTKLSDVLALPRREPGLRGFGHPRRRPRCPLFPIAAVHVGLERRQAARTRGRAQLATRASRDGFRFGDAGRVSESYRRRPRFLNEPTRYRAARVKARLLRSRAGWVPLALGNKIGGSVPVEVIRRHSGPAAATGSGGRRIADGGVRAITESGKAAPCEAGPTACRLDDSPRVISQSQEFAGR